MHKGTAGHLLARSNQQTPCLHLLNSAPSSMCYTVTHLCFLSLFFPAQHTVSNRTNGCTVYSAGLGSQRHLSYTPPLSLHLSTSNCDGGALWFTQTHSIPDVIRKCSTLRSTSRMHHGKRRVAIHDSQVACAYHMQCSVCMHIVTRSC